MLAGIGCDDCISLMPCLLCANRLRLLVVGLEYEGKPQGLSSICKERLLGMSLDAYLLQTEFAVKAIIDIICSDAKKLAELEHSLRHITAEFDVRYQIFLANEFHPAANYYHALMAKAHESQHTRQKQVLDDIEALTSTIDAKSASVGALAGALLQIAKQGISITYGKKQNAPKGAELGGLPIRDIIWEARNQTVHYENPREISADVVKIFEQIDATRADGVTWKPKERINYSFDVVRWLGWFDYNQYLSHMRSIRSK